MYYAWSVPHAHFWVTQLSSHKYRWCCSVFVFVFLLVICILSAVTLFWAGAVATVVKDKGRVSSLPLVALSCNTHKPIHSHQNQT